MLADSTVNESLVHYVFPGVTAGVAVLALVFNYLNNRQTAAQVMGETTQRVNEHHSDIQELKDSDTRQWQELSRQGKDIARLEGSRLGAD